MLEKLFRVENLLKKVLDGLRYLMSEYEFSTRHESLFKDYIERAREVVFSLKELRNTERIEELSNELRFNYLTSSHPDNFIKYLEMVEGKIFDVEEGLLNFYSHDSEYRVYSSSLMSQETENILEEIRGIGKWVLESRAGYPHNPYFFEISRVIDQYTYGHTKDINFSEEEFKSVYGDDIDRQLSEPESKHKKENPTKDQILLLSKLGVLDLPSIKSLTTENKGKLFAWLLNRNEKNVTECIRNCDPIGNKQAENNPYIYENKVRAVNQLLTDIGYVTKL